MAVLTFEKIRVQDLDQRLIDSIKAYFNSGSVRISVMIEQDTDKALLSLDEILEANRKSPYVVHFDADFDFNELADKVESDENFDVISVLEEHKIPYPNAASRTAG